MVGKIVKRKRGRKGSMWGEIMWWGKRRKEGESEVCGENIYVEIINKVY